MENVLKYRFLFPQVGTEEADISQAYSRILAEEVLSDENLPEFLRSTMDGYAICASSSYGASESNPAWLSIKGSVAMGAAPAFSIGPGETARIATGGMLPDGADAVVMIEHTETVDETSVEIYKSVAPGQHVIDIGEDFRRGETLLSIGQFLRSPEVGLLAAFGKQRIRVYRKPIVSIISTGDEIVPIEQKPSLGKIRDINSYTLSAQVSETGAIPKLRIVPDAYTRLHQICSQAISDSDMVLISGGSSVGVRDLTIDVLSSLPNSEILVHGISISPGKPTILAKVGNCAVWGLPGHVVSAMVVFSVVVRPFIEHISGLAYRKRFEIPAKLTRNIPSVHGRTDYVRVRLFESNGTMYAEPILGKSGLLNTMVKADGLIEIDINTEGLYQDSEVRVITAV
ncbi:MAG: molybdopterin molybdotransferase MoeA [Desulfobacteraceae bacterium]|nr:molybdopterin molybdotransferase MoeA [Desulfobacteraceae bacterium]